MGKLTTFRQVNSLKEVIQNRPSAMTVGFVPTMGALHDGHLSLVARALEENDIAVVSIFVNPTQFNNPADLEKYPRDIERDLMLLSTLNKDILVFTPDVDEVYPAGHKGTKVDLGTMATVMEGQFRPGHFDGVVEVVSRLFDIVGPDRAYFGLKDFQQLAVIRRMKEILGLDVTIVACETKREAEGLAQSSRNERLSPQQRKDALVIYKALLKAKTLFMSGHFNEIRPAVRDLFEKSTLKLEYCELVDPHTLEKANENSTAVQACIAAYCGDVRLIDNMLLEKNAI